MAGAVAQKEVAAPSAAELREVLQRALEQLDDDERAGPILRASRLAVRLRLVDLGLSLRVESSDDPRHHLRWEFEDGDDDLPAKLELSMDARTANAYLQGKESLAIAIAQGRVHCRGDARMALFCLPALKLVAEPYRSLVRERFPRLALS